MGKCSNTVVVVVAAVLVSNTTPDEWTTQNFIKDVFYGHEVRSLTFNPIYLKTLATNFVQGF